MDLGPICNMFNKSMNFVRRINREKIIFQTGVYKLDG